MNYTDILTFYWIKFCIIVIVLSIVSDNVEGLGEFYHNNIVTARRSKVTGHDN